MPVEIKELVIRTVVDSGGAEPRSGGGSSASAAPSGDAGRTEEIVQECVRQVLRVLARNKER
ncbi:MAG: DUF5908 family protein [Aestuariivirga sp.]